VGSIITAIRFSSGTSISAMALKALKLESGCSMV